eukprot:1157723-Pelagomonas_calceolata.AAC.2
MRGAEQKARLGAGCERLAENRAGKVCLEAGHEEPAVNRTEEASPGASLIGLLRLSCSKGGPYVPCNEHAGGTTEGETGYSGERLAGNRAEKESPEAGCEEPIGKRTRGKLGATYLKEPVGDRTMKKGNSHEV